MAAYICGSGREPMTETVRLMLILVIALAALAWAEFERRKE